MSVRMMECDRCHIEFEAKPDHTCIIISTNADMFGYCEKCSIRLQKFLDEFNTPKLLK